jgi:hypothetical protein
MMVSPHIARFPIFQKKAISKTGFSAEIKARAQRRFGLKRQL